MFWAAGQQSLLQDILVRGSFEIAMLCAPEAQLQAGRPQLFSSWLRVDMDTQVVMPESKIPLAAVKVESIDRRQARREREERKTGRILLRQRCTHHGVAGVHWLCGLSAALHMLHSDTLEQWFMVIATEAWGAGKAWEGMPCPVDDSALLDGQKC